MGAHLCMAYDGAPDDGKTKVFWTGHLTPGHEEARQRWLSQDDEEEEKKEEEEDKVEEEESRSRMRKMESKAEVKASMPPFNNANKMEIPGYVTTINAPAFGINIANAVMRIFELEEIKHVAKELGVSLPTNKLSRFVQEKMPKVHDMIRYARDDPDISKKGEPIDRLEKFVNEFQKLEPGTIESMVGWRSFVHQHTQKGWESKLHFDHLLSNFGFEKATSDKLRHATIKRSDRGHETFEKHSFRWLSKAFAAYGPEMALSDVVNLIFAMTKEPYDALSDVDVAKKIDDFQKKIRDKNFAGLWIPSHLFMDAACDDCMVWVLLTYMYKHIKTTDRKLKVLVQLPQGLDGLAEKLRALDVVQCEVWLDPDSRNYKEVNQYWNPS